MALKVVVGVISLFVLARNHYASGYLAMPLGAFHFACQSHIDVKCSLSQFGSIVGDTTTHANIKSTSHFLHSLILMAIFQPAFRASVKVSLQ